MRLQLLLVLLSLAVPLAVAAGDPNEEDEVTRSKRMPSGLLVKWTLLHQQSTNSAAAKLLLPKYRSRTARGAEIGNPNRRYSPVTSNRGRVRYMRVLEFDEPTQRMVLKEVPMSQLIHPEDFRRIKEESATSRHADGSQRIKGPVARLNNQVDAADGKSPELGLFVRSGQEEEAIRSLLAAIASENQADAEAILSGGGADGLAISLGLPTEKSSNGGGYALYHQVSSTPAPAPFLPPVSRRPPSSPVPFAPAPAHLPSVTRRPPSSSPVPVPTVAAHLPPVTKRPYSSSPVPSQTIAAHLPSVTKRPPPSFSALAVPTTPAPAPAASPSVTERPLPSFPALPVPTTAAPAPLLPLVTKRPASSSPTSQDLPEPTTAQPLVTNRPPAAVVALKTAPWQSKNQLIDVQAREEFLSDRGSATRYEFGYRVVDDQVGSDFGHEEARSDDARSDDRVTSGRYHVLLPDGKLQKVRYYVDKDGYHAVVTYEDAASSDSSR